MNPAAMGPATDVIFASFVTFVGNRIVKRDKLCKEKIVIMEKMG